jgi:hypothetical protein
MIMTFANALGARSLPTRTRPETCPTESGAVARAGGDKNNTHSSAMLKGRNRLECISGLHSRTPGGQQDTLRRAWIGMPEFRTVVCGRLKAQTQEA